MAVKFLMPRTLKSLLGVVFSETARPCPGHREAGGHERPRRLAASAVGGRGGADHAGEGAAEGAEAGETDLHADLGHAAVGLAQEVHRALDAPALQVAVRRLAE